MAIKQDPARPGFWYVSYGKRNPKTGRVVSLRRTMFKSYAEAKRHLPKLIIEVEDRIRRMEVPTWGTTLERFPEAFRKRGVTEDTIRDYMLSLKAYTLEPWGNRLVDTIAPAEIRELINTELASKSTSHQKNVLKMIKAVFEYVVDEGHLKVNPTPKMAFRVGDKIKAVLTHQQAQKLLTAAKAVNHPWYPVWCVALYTGMRNGELYALKWENVDLDKRKIIVSDAWNNVDGFKSTKSGNDRIVAIAPPLLHVLRELKLKAGDCPYVLPRIPSWKKGFQALVLRTFLKGLGLPTVRFHDLRATWATLLLSQGVAPAQVMAMGGWSDMKTMMIYMRKAGIDVAGATDCLVLHNPTEQMAELINFERAL